MRCSYCKAETKVLRTTNARDASGSLKVWCGTCPTGKKDVPKPRKARAV